MEGAIEGPREAQAPWDCKEYEGHEQDWAVGDTFILFLLIFRLVILCSLLGLCGAVVYNTPHLILKQCFLK